MLPDRQSPADPARIFPQVDRNELEDWFHAGGLDIQQYEQYYIAKGFDTVLGPLYYTDRHTFPVMESVAREAPCNLDRLIEWGAHDHLSCNYQIWSNLANYETPLFCVTIVFGLGVALIRTDPF